MTFCVAVEVTWSDGELQVGSCLPVSKPARWSLLVREGGLPPISEYQVFDSIDQVLNAIKNISGHLFEWDGAELQAKKTQEAS